MQATNEVLIAMIMYMYNNVGGHLIEKCSGGYRGGVGGVRTPPSDLMMNKIKD